MSSLNSGVLTSLALAGGVALFASSGWLTKLGIFVFGIGYYGWTKTQTGKDSCSPKDKSENWIEKPLPPTPDEKEFSNSTKGEEESSINEKSSVLTQNSLSESKGVIEIVDDFSGRTKTTDKMDKTKKHSELLDEVSSFSSDKLHSVTTVEPLAPSDYFNRDTLLLDIKAFDKEKLRESEREEKNILPSKKDIEEEYLDIKSSLIESKNVYERVLSQVEDFNPKDLISTSSQVSSFLPDKIDLVTERAREAMLAQVENLRKSNSPPPSFDRVHRELDIGFHDEGSGGQEDKFSGGSSPQKDSGHHLLDDWTK